MFHHLSRHTGSFNPAHTKRQQPPATPRTPSQHPAVEKVDDVWRGGAVCRGGVSARLSCRCHGDAWSATRHSEATVREPDGRHEVRLTRLEEPQVGCRFSFFTFKMWRGDEAASTLLYIQSYVLFLLYSRVLLSVSWRFVLLPWYFF